MRLLLPTALVLAGACTCQPFGPPDGGLYRCIDDSDCLPGYDCIGRVCLPEGTPTAGGSTAGGRAGGAEAGGGGDAGGSGTAGGANAGGGVAGGATAGGGLAGGSTAGGSTAGGNAGGGSTAGGNAGGGSTAGGNTAGGNTAGGNTAGGNTAGGAAGGTAGGNPFTLQMEFITNGHTFLASSCSPAITVELQNLAGAPAPQTGSVNVSLSATPSGLLFYNSSTCGAQIGSATIPAMQARATFYVRSTMPNTYNVTVSAPMAASAAQQQVVTPQTPTKLVFTNVINAGVGAGACRQLVVQQQDASSVPVVAPAAGVPVTLDATPATVSPVRFFTNNTCTTSAGSMVVIPAGQSSVTFYASAWTGTSYNLSASFGALTPGTQGFSVRPLVRRGSCALGMTATSVSCTIPAPVQVSPARTALFYQAVSSSASLAQSAVRCELSGAALITCARSASGSPVTVHWQTAEVDTGFTVLRTTVACPNDGGTRLFVPFTNPGSFVLASQSTGTTSLDGTTLATAQRADGGVVLEWAEPCVTGGGGYQVALQAVSVTGSTAQAGGAAMAAGSTSAAVPLGAGGSGTPFVLTTHALTSGGDDELCSRAVRAGSSGTSVTVTRANGSASPACANEALPDVWAERVYLNTLGTVDAVNATMSQSDLNATVALPRAVDATRTLVFASGQYGGGGQGGGESALNSGNALGDAVAAHVLDAGADLSSQELFLLRGSALGSARWTSYVVELGP